MKIKINRDTFFRVFQVAAAVAPARSPKAILQNVKLVVSKSEALLTATDMEIGVRLNLPDIEVESPGSAVVPVTRLSMILRESRDEFLEIETNEEKTIVKGLSSRFELQSFNPDEFPEVAEFTGEDYYEVKAKDLRRLIHRTLYATDTESTRYALGGILLEMTDDTVIGVGTDGRRLAKMESLLKAIGNPSDGGGTTIVPTRAMQLIERILPDDDSLVQLLIRANEFLLRDNKGEFYTRLVEGRFPKWREVMAERTGSNLIEIPVGPMYSALRQAAIVSSEESRGVDFTFENGTLVLSSSTAEVGESRVELPAPYEGETLSISLDNRFVGDFLKVLPPESNFTFDIMASDQAVYCFTDDGYRYVIMPMATNR